MTINERELRWRSALQSLKKQSKSSKRTVKRLAKEGALIEALRLQESTSGLNWAITHIERWLNNGSDK